MNREKKSHKGLSLPSLGALRCFEVAARTEHFSRAAEELHLTHGAISRAVRQLEDELGVALFERRQRRVFLTEAGAELYRAVREGLSLIRETADRLQRLGASVPLVVSCEPTLLMRWLIPRWPDFQADHPDLDIHLVAGGGPIDFGAGINLAIRRNDFRWPEHIFSSTLFTERIGPVCRPDLTWRFFPEGQLADTAPRLHTRTRPSSWDDWLRARGECHTEQAPNQVFEHFYFSLQAAVAGLGVAIGPYRQVCDDLAAGLLVAPLGFIEDGSRYCLLAPAAPEPDSPHARLLHWLITQIKHDEP